MRATRRTAVWALVMLALLSFARPAMADGLPDGTIEDPGPTEIDTGQPHATGYVANRVRRNAVATADAVPDSVDLRPYAPAVGDQGSIGQCVAWTISRNLMGYYAGRTGAVDAPYSPLFLYMRNVASGGAPNSGLNPDAVLANLKANGVDSQDDYFQGTANYKVAPTTQEIANATNYRISGWTRLWSGSNQGPNAQTMIRAALANGDPVAVGFPVYSDFMNLGTHTLYNTLSGTSLGGHMVTAFGYDADGVYLRNQWGTGWGNSGDAHVSWAFVQQVMSGAYTISGITTPASSVPVTPQVTSLSATRGSAGSTVVITGAGLGKTSAVRFGGTSATFSITQSNGVNRVFATAPARSGGTTDITVTNPSGTSADTAADDYTYPQPAPAISGMSPTSGGTPGGTRVTVTGSNLGGATVRIGANTVDPVTNSDSALTFTVPAASAGAAAVKVTTSGGTVPAGTFTYVSPPAPVLSSLTPNSAPDSRTTSVTLTGSYFGDATAVSVDGEDVAFTRVSDTQLRISMPPHAAGGSGVTVTGPGGTSAARIFTYTAYGVPTVTSLSPSSGANNVATTVTVTGTDLSDITGVKLGSTALSWTSLSATSLRVTVQPRAAGAADLVVTTRGGSSAPVTWTAVAPVRPARPVIDALSPGVGPAAATTAVTVTGSGFTGATRLTLGGVSTAFTVVSDSRITFTAPKHEAGSATVVVLGPGGSSAARTFTWTSAMVPSISTLSPNSGVTTGSTTTVITGRYLGGASLVTAGTSRVSFVRVSDTQIRITLVKRAAGPVSIKVTTAGGTSNGLTFTYRAPGAPVVTSLSGGTGTAGATKSVTVSGSNLQGVTRVTVGGTGAAFRLGSATSFTVTMPAKTAGTYAVIVTTAGGTSRPIYYTVR